MMYSLMQRRVVTQNGQALAEFAVSVGILVFCLMLIPMLGRLLEIRLTAEQAASAVTWERTLNGRLRDDTTLSTLIGRRYFASATGVLTSSIEAVAPVNQKWLDDAGHALIAPPLVRVVTNRQEDGSFGLMSVVRKGLGLSTDERVIGEVRVPLVGLPAWLSPGGLITIQAKQAGVGKAWAADSQAEIVSRIEGSATIHPYPKYQLAAVNTLNRFFSGVFNEPKINKSQVQPDAVPADRLVPYVNTP